MLFGKLAFAASFVAVAIASPARRDLGSALKSGVTRVNDAAHTLADSFATFPTTGATASQAAELASNTGALTNALWVIAQLSPSNGPLSDAEVSTVLDPLSVWSGKLTDALKAMSNEKAEFAALGLVDAVRNNLQGLQESIGAALSAVKKQATSTVGKQNVDEITSKYSDAFTDVLLAFA